MYVIASSDARQQTARDLSIIQGPPSSRMLILLPFRPAIGNKSFSFEKRSRSSSLRPRSASTRAFLGLCSAAVDDEIVSDDAMALSDVEQWVPYVDFEARSSTSASTLACRGQGVDSPWETISSTSGTAQVSVFVKTPVSFGFPEVPMGRGEFKSASRPPDDEGRETAASWCARYSWLSPWRDSKFGGGAEETKEKGES